MSSYVLFATLLVGLLLSFVLPTKGLLGDVRIGLCGGALFAVPALLVIGRADIEGDAIVRTAGVAMASMAFYVLVAFLAIELRVNLDRGAFVIPAVAEGCILLVALRPRPSTRTGFASLGLAVLLGGSAVAAAVVTHLALPAVPIESSYSLSTAAVVFHGNTLTISIDIARVHFSGPIFLNIYVNNAGVGRDTVRGTASEVTIKVHLARSVGACVSNVSIKAANGAYLSPYIPCRT